MATLLVRKLEAELVERLRQRARAHGRSVEAEHREILRAALEPELSGRDLFELLRQGDPFPAEADPDSWRIDDRGEPADL
ncbi:MAG: FitA-like ribbon-helix-helix domain-containing protein [Geminicoccaceae bacterium]